MISSSARCSKMWVIVPSVCVLCCRQRGHGRSINHCQCGQTVSSKSWRVTSACTLAFFKLWNQCIIFVNDANKIQLRYFVFVLILTNQTHRCQFVSIKWINVDVRPICELNHLVLSKRVTRLEVQTLLLSTEDKWKGIQKPETNHPNMTCALALATLVTLV